MPVGNQVENLEMKHSCANEFHFSPLKPAYFVDLHE